MILLFIPLISFLDWFRGQGKPEGIGTIKKLLLGCAMSFAMGFESWELVAATVLCSSAFASGWGSALGAALRKDCSSMGPNYENYWQSELVNRLTWGTVRSDPLTAMAIRGVWGFLFVSPLVYLNFNVLNLLPVFALSFSVPAILTNKWKIYECIRGAFIGSGCVLIGVM